MREMFTHSCITFLSTQASIIDITHGPGIKLGPPKLFWWPGEVAACRLPENRLSWFRGWDYGGISGDMRWGAVLQDCTEKVHSVEKEEETLYEGKPGESTMSWFSCSNQWWWCITGSFMQRWSIFNFSFKTGNNKHFYNTDRSRTGLHAPDVLHVSQSADLCL